MVQKAFTLLSSRKKTATKQDDDSSIATSTISNGANIEGVEHLIILGQDGPISVGKLFGGALTETRIGMPAYETSAEC